MSNGVQTALKYQAKFPGFIRRWKEGETAEGIARQLNICPEAARKVRDHLIKCGRIEPRKAASQNGRPRTDAGTFGKSL